MKGDNNHGTAGDHRDTASKTESGPENYEEKLSSAEMWWRDPGVCYTNINVWPVMMAW